MYKVKKRDGAEVAFEMAKIKSAIKRTFESCERQYQDSIIDTICIRSIANAEKSIKNGLLSVEDIQDSVEQVLMSCGYEDVAKAYILYRKQHERNRNAKQTLLDYKKLIEGYTQAQDWRVKENSTVTYSLGGLILGNSGAVTANYWLSEVYDEEIAEAHRNCDIHIHDLSMLSGYCFTGDTVVQALDGKNRTFEQLVNDGVKELWVYSYDTENNMVVTAKAENPRITRYVDEIVEVVLDNGNIIRCTKDHPFMLRDGTYLDAEKLTPGMSLMPYGVEDANYNHKVKSIQIIKLDSTIPVYDLTVPKYHNFAVGGVFVHNCAGWSLKALLKKGLGGVPGKIESAPAKHLFTLCNQMVNFLGCFTDDTRIVLSDGTTPTIRQMLDSGETSWVVKSYDPKTNEVVDAIMDNLHKTRTVDEYMELEFEDGDIVKCTPDHKFYTYNRGWVEARDLTEDDDVANLDYNKYIVKLVKKRVIHETRDVYCGTVHNDFHGFFVNDGKLVHNCLQNEWAGAQAFSSVDTYLAPFVKADGLSYKEVKQCIQSLIFGLNIPSRWGSQPPFTNFTMDWTVPDDLAELPCIVGGVEQEFKYKDCKREMDMINRAFIEVMVEGDANGRGFQYPISYCGVYQ